MKQSTIKIGIGNVIVFFHFESFQLHDLSPPSLRSSTLRVELQMNRKQRKKSNFASLSWWLFQYVLRSSSISHITETDGKNCFELLSCWCEQQQDRSFDFSIRETNIYDVCIDYFSSVRWSARAWSRLQIAQFEELSCWRVWKHLAN